MRLTTIAALIALPPLCAAPARAWDPTEPWETPEHTTIDEATLLDRIAHEPLPTAPARPARAWDRRSRPRNLAQVRAQLVVRDEEQALLHQNGFVVLAASQPHPTQAYVWIYNHDLPVFVTMDSLFHALAAGHEALLDRLEADLLAPTVARALAAMHADLPRVASAWDADVARDVDLYLTVARSLLAEAPIAPTLTQDVAAERDAWLTRIADAGSTTTVVLFGRERRVDLTRFAPRGRHAGDPARERWFRAYHWLAHVELNLVSRDSRSSAPGLAGDPRPTPREVAVAWALGRLAADAGVALELGRASDLLDVVVAPRADVPLEAVLDLAGDDPDSVADADAIDALDDRLTRAVGDLYPRVAPTHPTPPVTRQPVVATLLGLRPSEGTDLAAHLLSPANPALAGADVAYALGHDRARAHLAQRLARDPRLAAGLAAARAELAGRGDDGTLRAAWLDAIAALARDRDPPGARPSFMRGPAWDDRRLDAALAAYTQLRHAHILYEAQAHFEGGCDIPDAFVEPAPATLAALERYAARGAELADYLDPDDAHGARGYFARMGRIFAALARIVAHELAGQPPTDAQREFLHRIADERVQGYDGITDYDGWFFDLFFEVARTIRTFGGLSDERAALPSDPDFLAPADLVADVATYADETGTWVSHLGTTRAHYGLFVVDVGGAPRVLVGPVGSSWAYAAGDGARLTDVAARALTPGERQAPWVASFAPWLARVDPPEPELVVRIDDSAEDDRGVTHTFVVEAAQPVANLELRLVDVRNDVIARRRLSVAAGTTRVQLRTPPERYGDLVVKLGAIERRTGDEVDADRAIFGPRDDAGYDLE